MNETEGILALIHLSHSSPLSFRADSPAGQVKTGMTMLVWHRHSCRCLLPPEGRFRTGRSACATQFLAPMRHLSLKAENERSRNAGVPSTHGFSVLGWNAGD